jgi:hypothetical protein
MKRDAVPGMSINGRQASVGAHGARLSPVPLTLERLSRVFGGCLAGNRCFPIRSGSISYEHTPPAPGGGLRDDFARVVLRFEEGEFKDPQWRHFPVIPRAIQSARFYCAQDATYGFGRVAIPIQR